MTVITEEDTEQSNLEQLMDECSLPEYYTFTEAYNRLLPVVKGAEDDREYLHWIVVHPDGYAIATDANILGVIPCQTGNLEEPIALPQVESHKTDDITITRNSSGTVIVEVDCNHKNDHSGTYESKLLENIDYPDYNMVIPDPDSYGDNHNSSRVKINPDIMVRLRDAIGDNGLRLSLLTEDSPILVRGKYGFGVLMPMRVK